MGYQSDVTRGEGGAPTPRGSHRGGGRDTKNSSLLSGASSDSDQLPLYKYNMEHKGEKPRRS